MHRKPNRKAGKVKPGMTKGNMSGMTKEGNLEMTEKVELGRARQSGQKGQESNPESRRAGLGTQENKPGRTKEGKLESRKVKPERKEAGCQRPRAFFSWVS